MDMLQRCRSDMSNGGYQYAPVQMRLLQRLYCELNSLVYSEAAADENARNMQASSPPMMRFLG